METESLSIVAPGRPHEDGSERRLFRRYPAGLPAELRTGGEPLACRLSDISLGGACIELTGRRPSVGCRGTLRSPAIASGHAFVVEVRQAFGTRLHLAFELDDEADHELTLFLMDSAVTMARARPD